MSAETHGRTPLLAEAGATATQQEIAEVAIAILADGKGLPPGRGDYAAGKAVYETACAACHCSRRSKNPSLTATSFRVECPTGSGQMRTLFEVACDISERLTCIFLRDASGRRPLCGGAEKFQSDPHWRDHLLFYEYFHGDNGAGPGASHQTGWTGLVAIAIQLFGLLEAKHFLERGHEALYSRSVVKR